MVKKYSQERLSDLLVEPRETLDFEVKNWLDLQSSNEDKARLVKAILALANHGGGFVALGLEETDTGIIEAPGRPTTFDAYSQDRVNGIVHSYCDPAFHCGVQIVPNEQGAGFPIVVVPGGHRVPVRARRSGPNGEIVQNHAIYIRKPGPQSEPPQNAQEWDDLLARCLRNRRDEMFDQIRELISGSVPQAEVDSEAQELDKWTCSCMDRWEFLVEGLPEGVGPRLPHGRYYFSYEIAGDLREIAGADFAEIVRESVVRHTGWPPFWYPTREGIAPYPFNDAIECWIGGDPKTPVEERDSAHSDFWRIHPNGLAFLLRGFQEDSPDMRKAGHTAEAPGTLFDVTLPVWRIGEALLHAQSLAKHLSEESSSIKFRASYEGLAGRTLTSMTGRRPIVDGRVARQDSKTVTTHVDVELIDSNLPEIVHPLLSPLYSLFDFFELPEKLVSEELARMRSGAP